MNQVLNNGNKNFTRNNLSIFLIIYLILLHVIIIILFFKTDSWTLIKAQLGVTPKEMDAYYYRMLAFHTRIDDLLGPGNILFIGDSHIQGLCISCITSDGVNFGIGGDTTSGVYKRIQQYRSLDSAKAIVIQVGVNDLIQKDVARIMPSYIKILGAVPERTSILFSGVLPIDSEVALKNFRTNEMIRLLNQEIESICNNYPKCSYIDSSNKLVNKDGDLKKQYHIGDGVHLNSAGYEIWIQDLKKALMSGLKEDDS